MTGRDLIVYILSNNLENEPVFKNGSFVGFITVEEAAVKMNVGVETIYVWMSQGWLKHFRIGETYFVPADCRFV